MKIYLAADHAGFSLKNELLEHLTTFGNDVIDCGAFELDETDDYPDFVQPLTAHVVSSPESFGIICAGSGQGEGMCANRVPGVRAAVFYGPLEAQSVVDASGTASEDGYDVVRLSRKHNNANVLSLGARFVTSEQAKEAVRIFLETEFSGDDRHIRRLGKF